MIVTVASGKGGTGKTSVAVNMALGVGCVQFLDCDVEEPNAHLLLHSTQIRTQPVHAAVPIINEALCSHCGACSKFCRYNALFTTKEETLVFPELCHSCGGCIRVCPQKAIMERQHRIGTLHFDVAGDLSLVYGELTA